MFNYDSILPELKHNIEKLHDSIRKIESLIGTLYEDDPIDNIEDAIEEAPEDYDLASEVISELDEIQDMVNDVSYSLADTSTTVHIEVFGENP